MTRRGEPGPAARARGYGARPGRRHMSGGQYTRRELVKAGAAGAAAGTLATAGPAEAKRRRRKPRVRRADVVVVGAGLAGLTAARQLRRARKSVIVLEARSRVGGRCYSKRIPGGASDVANMGATFVGPTQHRVIDLCKELGIPLFNTYDTGKYIDYRNGGAHPYSGRIPPVSPIGLAQLQLVITRLDQMSAQV